MMTPKQFWLRVAQWGSAQTAGDPGACLYGFDEHGLMQSEQHRADCLEQLELLRKTQAELGATDDVKELTALIDYAKAAPVAGASLDLDSFTDAYLEAMLWSSSVGLEENDDTSFRDGGYTAAQLAPETLERIRADCALFQKHCGAVLDSDALLRQSEHDVLEMAGHDFWLTRNGHGSGFWDTGRWRSPIGDLLDKTSKAFGETDLYLGDDGRLYLMGGDPKPSLPAMPEGLLSAPAP